MLGVNFKPDALTGNKIEWKEATMKKKLNKKQKATGFLAWAAILSFLIWVITKSVFGIILLFR